MTRLSITEARKLGIGKGKGNKIHYADQQRIEKKNNTLKLAWENKSAEQKKS